MDDELPALDEIDCQRTLSIIQARMFGEEPAMPQFDRFVVLRSAGEGAMGRVYVARDPSLDREVAIKVIRVVGDEEVDRARRKRLEQEARAAARISHPNVVTIHEVGVNDENVFVVMEYIEGQTLREWLKAKKRPYAEIVAVFVQAGRGLAAAHAQGLVHRDFKPDNVLVGDDGRICVVDFGLVKVSSESPPETAERPAAARPMDSSAASVTQGAVGTPAYMSPEQRDGRPVDARSDQYSFCVALYEAHHGARPRLGESVAWSPDKSEAVPTWMGDVVMRGMQQQPELRFETMAALLEALVEDPSQKRRSRRRLWIGAAAVGGGLLWLAARTGGDGDPCPDGAGLVGATWNERARAEVRDALQGRGSGPGKATFDRVATELDGYAEDWAQHRDAACRQTRVTREQPEVTFLARLRCLDDRERHLAAAVSVLSEVDATVAENAVSVVGRLPSVSLCSDLAYLAADVKPPQAEAERAALAQLERRLSAVRVESAAGSYEAAAKRVDAMMPAVEQLDYAPMLAASLLERGHLHGLLGDHKAQRSTLQRSFYVATAAGDDRTALAAAMALIYLPGRVDDGSEDLQWAQTAAALIDRGGPEQASQRAELAVAQGRVHYERGEFEQALERFAEGLKGYEDLHGDEAAYRIDVARIANYMGGAQTGLGKMDESAASFERALTAAEDVYGPDHPRVATVLINLAQSRRGVGAFSEAAALLDRAHVIATAAYGRAHPKISRILGNQAALELGRGRADVARLKFEEVVEIAREVYGPDHRELAMALNNLGFLNSELGRYDAADAALQEALSIAGKLPGAKGVVAAILNNQGIVHNGRGEQGRALHAYERSVKLTRELVGDDHPDVAGGYLNIGNVLVALGRHAEAERRFRAAQEGFERVPGDQRLSQIGALRGIAICRWKQGDPAEAMERFAALRAVELDVVDPGAPSLASTPTSMGEIEAEAGRHAAAVGHFEVALAQLGDKEVPAAVRTAVQLGLARSLWALGDERERARRLATDAEVVAAAAEAQPGAGGGVELAAVRDWLGTHPL